MGPATLIRLARQRRGLTQSDLARRVGTSQPVISAYEHGRRDPSVATLGRIIAGTGERLVIGLADANTGTHSGGDLVTPRDHADALVDVLLLADAIPLRRMPSRTLKFPRIDSTRLHSPLPARTVADAS